MTQDEKARERERLATLAMTLIAKRGKLIDRADLAAEAGTSRSRVEALFPEEDTLFDAIVEHWYADDIAAMEDVIASELPIQRKFYEFFARRFLRERERFREDPALFALYCELGTAKFDHVRGYIDLADHYLTELIAQAQDEGYFEGLTIDRALTLINQMVVCYTSPQLMMIIDERLEEDKLAAIIDTMFAGLTVKAGSSKGVAGLRAA